METILEEIKKSCKRVSYLINNFNSIELSLNTVKVNASSERIRNLDELANSIFLNNLKNCDNIKYICSEEEKKIVEHNKIGNYIVCYDPLDGSSNIKSNITIGSIFGIYEYDILSKQMKKNTNS